MVFPAAEGGDRSKRLGTAQFPGLLGWLGHGAPPGGEWLTLEGYGVVVEHSQSRRFAKVLRSGELLFLL